MFRPILLPLSAQDFGGFSMKTKIFSLSIALLMFFPVMTFAESSAEKKEPAVEEAKKDKQKEREQMMSMVMSMLGNIQKQMVATGDGGIVVLKGNKLLKYDKDLNLIKVVELKTDLEPSGQ
jgi:hypothetical protein